MSFTLGCLVFPLQTVSEKKLRECQVRRSVLWLNITFIFSFFQKKAKDMIEVKEGKSKSSPCVKIQPGLKSNNTVQASEEM